MSEIKPQLLHLTLEEKRALKVIFLARHAPLTADGPKPEIHDEFGVEPRYNHEIFSLLREMGVDCVSCSSLDELPGLARNANFVFTLFNRADFRNGEIFVSLQCEKLGIPYLGAPPNVRALAEDKSFAKHVASSLGIKTPEWKNYSVDSELEPPAFSGPYFVKPRFGAASDSIAIDSIQEEWGGLKAKIENLLAEGKDAIVEQCIDGSDLTVPVLGGFQPIILDVVEEVSDLPSGISTYRQKRLLDKGRFRRILDNSAVTQEVIAGVRRFCAKVNPFDYLRVDFHLCKKTQAPYFLEFNIGCNLGSHAGIMFAATNQGLTQQHVIEHILAYSLRRQYRSVSCAIERKSAFA